MREHILETILNRKKLATKFLRHRRKERTQIPAPEQLAVRVEEAPERMEELRRANNQYADAPLFACSYRTCS